MAALAEINEVGKGADQNIGRKTPSDISVSASQIRCLPSQISHYQPVIIITADALNFMVSS